MNLFHLFAVSALVLSFSGQPIPYHQATVPAAISAPATDSTLIGKGETDLIPWAPATKLNWDDFMCEPKRGTDAVASTSTSLGIAYQMVNGKLSYHITCNFSKNKSWGLMKTDYILAHEQGHFDITEIFARKLNEALQNYNFNRRSFKNDINDIYQSIVAEKEQYQTAYDEETDHSRSKKIQYEWLDRIQTMLTETQPYAAYP